MRINMKTIRSYYEKPETEWIVIAASAAILEDSYTYPEGDVPDLVYGGGD